MFESLKTKATERSSREKERIQHFHTYICSQMCCGSVLPSVKI